MNAILEEMVTIQQAHMRLLNCKFPTEKPVIARSSVFREYDLIIFKNNLFSLMVLDVIYGKKPRGCLTVHVVPTNYSELSVVVFAETIENMKAVKYVQFLNYDSFNSKNKAFSFCSTPCIKTNNTEYKFFLSEEAMNIAMSFLIYPSTANNQWTEHVAELFFKTPEDIGNIMMPAGVLINSIEQPLFKIIDEYIRNYKFPNDLTGDQIFKDMQLNNLSRTYNFSHLADTMGMVWNEIYSDYFHLYRYYNETTSSFVLQCLGILNRRGREIKSDA